VRLAHIHREPARAPSAISAEGHTLDGQPSPRRREGQAGRPPLRREPGGTAVTAREGEATRSSARARAGGPHGPAKAYKCAPYTGARPHARHCAHAVRGGASSNHIKPPLSAAVIKPPSSCRHHHDKPVHATFRKGFFRRGFRHFPKAVNVENSVPRPGHAVEKSNELAYAAVINPPSSNRHLPVIKPSPSARHQAIDISPPSIKPPSSHHTATSRAPSACRAPRAEAQTCACRVSWSTVC